MVSYNRVNYPVVFIDVTTSDNSSASGNIFTSISDNINPAITEELSLDTGVITMYSITQHSSGLIVKVCSVYGAHNANITGSLKAFSARVIESETGLGLFSVVCLVL